MDSPIYVAAASGRSIRAFPDSGRAEYLYFKPVVVAQAPAAEGGGRSEPAAVLPPAPAPAAAPPVQAAPARPPVRAPHAPGPRVRRDRS